MSETNSPNVRLEKKLSPKTIMSKTISKALFDDKGTPVDLFVVAGLARGLKTGESNFGPYTEFHGDFGAVDQLSGELVRANRLLLPPVVTNPLREAVTAAEGGTVEFCYMIGIRPDPKGERGYEYTCKPVKAPKESDEFAAIANRYLTSPGSAPAALPPAKDEKGGKGKK